MNDIFEVMVVRFSTNINSRTKIVENFFQNVRCDTMNQLLNCFYQIFFCSGVFGVASFCNVIVVPQNYQKVSE